MPSQLSEIIPENLVSRIKAGAELLNKSRRVRIFCHYDPDGAASAAILAKAMIRKGREFQISLTTAINDDFISKFGEEGVGLVIMADMGSSHLETLERLEGAVIVLDHHKPDGDSDKVVHINPHLVGIDGARDVCGATLAWIFSIALDEANWDLAGIAMAGAVGDRQHVDGFTGLNATMFKKAVELKILVPERNLSLRDMPLADAIAHNLSPYFVGLGGRRDDCVRFLEELGIDADISLRKLPPKGRKRLTSMLAVHLLKQGTQPEAMKTLVEDKYWIPDRGLYADEMSAFMNSCSRLGREGMGVSLALGDNDVLKEAEALREDYYEKVVQYLLKLEKEIFKKKNVQFFYCPEPTLAGAVAGIGMQYFFEGTKPVLSFSVLDKVTKVSSRGTRTLVEKGLNLASALAEASSSVGGRGGGHDIAAGATINKGKEEKFISLVDDIVERQLRAEAEE